MDTYQDKHIKILSDFIHSMIRCTSELESEMGAAEWRQLKFKLFEFLTTQSECLATLLEEKNNQTNHGVYSRRLASKALLILKSKLNNKYKTILQRNRLAHIFHEWMRQKATGVNPKRLEIAELPQHIDRLFELTESDLNQLARQIVKSEIQQTRIIPPNADIVLISHLFPTTWAPLIEKLQKDNKRICWLGNRSVFAADGYGVLTDPLIPVDEKRIMSIFSMLLTLNSDNDIGNVFLSGEAFIGANWKQVNAVALYTVIYAFVTAAKSSTKTKLWLILYDALKPISDNVDVGNALSFSYSKMLSASDALIFNSNTPRMTNFIQNAYKISKPSINHYRYPNFIAEKEFKSKSDIHLAAITVCLSEFDEPSRNKISPHIREILAQKIHFHYFCETKSKAIRDFKSKCSPEELKYFHEKPIIYDQNELVRELSNYDFGINPSDHSALAAGISAITDRKYMDGMDVFWQSTIATSFLVYAAAGLPSILPRGCIGAQELLGPFAIPLNPSEYHNLHSVLETFHKTEISKISNFDRSIFSNAGSSSYIELLEGI